MQYVHRYTNTSMLAYRCLTGTAPQYLADTLSQSTIVATRCRLRSVDSRTLQLPSTRRTTLGDRAFSIAAARAWNSLPPEIRNKRIRHLSDSI